MEEVLLSIASQSYTSLAAAVLRAGGNTGFLASDEVVVLIEELKALYTWVEIRDAAVQLLEGKAATLLEEESHLMQSRGYLFRNLAQKLRDADEQNSYSY